MSTHNQMTGLSSADGTSMTGAPLLGLQRHSFDNLLFSPVTPRHIVRMLHVCGEKAVRKGEAHDLECYG